MTGRCRNNNSIFSPSLVRENVSNCHLITKFAASEWGKNPDNN
jgi:hypothetical protein